MAGYYLAQKNEAEQLQTQVRVPETPYNVFPLTIWALLHGHYIVISPSFRAEDLKMETWGGKKPFQTEIKTNHIFAY